MTTITSSIGGSSTPLSTAAPAQPTDREKLKAAAKQFEAIFTRQFLAEARKTRFDDDGLFDNQAMDTFRQMQDERFADTAAERGSLGLATIIEAQLARFVPQQPAPAKSGEQK